MVLFGKEQVVSTGKLYKNVWPLFSEIIVRKFYVNISRVAKSCKILDVEYSCSYDGGIDCER